MNESNILIAIGITIVLVGLLWKLGIKLGHLPGDIIVKRDNFRFYLPITTSFVISGILTVVFVLYRLIA